MTERLTLVWNREKAAAALGKFKIYCLRCSDTGKMLAIRRDGPALPYAFICDCVAGERCWKAFPRWTPELAKDYLPYTSMVEWEVQS